MDAETKQHVFETKPFKFDCRHPFKKYQTAKGEKKNYHNLLNFTKHHIIVKWGSTFVFNLSLGDFSNTALLLCAGVVLCADRICHAPVTVSGLFDLWPLVYLPTRTLPPSSLFPSPLPPPHRPPPPSSEQRSVSENSLVAMDFSGRTGRVIDNPVEAQSAALEEGHTWRVRHQL